MLNILDLGLPTASEMLDTIIPQYLLVGMLGIIRCENNGIPATQKMSSGLSMPIGFKNSTTGDPVVAINAMQVACQSHSFVEQINMVRYHILKPKEMMRFTNFKRW